MTHALALPLLAPVEAIEGVSASGVSSVSVIVPTYREAENLPLLIGRLDAVRRAARLDLELFVMDDNSQDGTEGVMDSLALPWTRLVVRSGERGLSPAVIDGYALCRKQVVVVMDADLSHPPEKIPEILERIAAGADFVIGSRYVAGGRTHARWSVFRALNSSVATLLARPFTRVADPMSGFFAFRRELLDSAAPLSPVGYKIGLESLVKLPIKRVVEVPIFFAERAKGQSKLTLREQLRYLRHLRRLFVFKYPEASKLVQFLAVGAIGLAVNLILLTLLLLAGAGTNLAIGLAIGLSMLGNFALNRRFTFAESRRQGLLRQLLSFVAACSLGAVVNYEVSLGLLAACPGWLPQAASCCGIIAGTGLNYGANRLVTFR